MRLRDLTKREHSIDELYHLISILLVEVISPIAWGIKEHRYSKSQIFVSNEFIEILYVVKV